MSERRTRSVQALEPAAAARSIRQETWPAASSEATADSSRVSSRRRHRLRLKQPQNTDDNPAGRTEADETILAEQSPLESSTHPRGAVEQQPGTTSFSVGQVPQILFGESPQSWGVLGAEESIDKDGVETSGENNVRANGP